MLPSDGLVSEGEFLDITEIKRQQAEDYECITNNGVAPADQRKVKVTVNCKCTPVDATVAIIQVSLNPLWMHNYLHQGGCAFTRVLFALFFFFSSVCVPA